MAMICGSRSSSTGLNSAARSISTAQTEAAYGSTGFHEKALVTRVEQHGLMASVMSFEVRLRRDDAEPLMRGLNHFQLLNDGERWWIISNVGVIESESSPLPLSSPPLRAPQRSRHERAWKPATVICAIARP